MPWKGKNPYFIEFHTGAYLSRKAVNEGTELAFDLEERDNIDFGKQAHRGESREKLSARLKRNETNNQID